MSYPAIFLIAFILPMIYWRTLFYIAKHKFNAPFTRTKTGLQVHHLHFGVIFLVVAVEMLLISGQSYFFWILLGLSMGLIIDEYIASLMLPGNRPLELDIYDKAFKPTVVLFGGFTAVTMALVYFLA